MKFGFGIFLLAFVLITLGVMSWMYFLYEFKNTTEDNIKKNAEKINLMMINRIDSMPQRELLMW